MTCAICPALIPNWIAGRQVLAKGGEVLDKFKPTNGSKLFELTRSRVIDVDLAVSAAVKAQAAWAEATAIARGGKLYDICGRMQARRLDIASTVASETGKSLRDALGETDGAIALGRFFAGEGQRLYSRTLTSGIPNKFGMSQRQAIGVAGLIIAANTPIANVAWKVFPALICGNAAVLKAAEDTPATAWLFAEIAHQAGLPDGVLNVVQGLGIEAGAPIVEHPEVGVISFTGSTAVGCWIAETAGKRLARVSLELGGKNPLVVCDDADLDNAVKWILLSAFSNAGQRCASASRIIIFDSIYDELRNRLIQATNLLKVGPDDGDDLGPVINARQLENMLAAVSQAVTEGVSVLTGGKRLDGGKYTGGYYMAPTLLENVSPKASISNHELFGPIAALYRVHGFKEALILADDSSYGLTSCIHTKDFNRAMEFVRRIRSGTTVINAGTFGSEPHMPFGGFKKSGNGSREPGVEALDIYSELKNIHFNINPEAV